MRKKRSPCMACLTEVNGGGVGQAVTCSHHGPDCHKKSCNGWTALDGGGFGFIVSCCGHDACILIRPHTVHASQRMVEGSNADYET